jgi:dihydroorotate dehydrogenase electron transfer subunit
VTKHDNRLAVPQYATPAEILAAVVANDWVNPEYKLLVLDARAPAPLAAAGQFFQLACPYDEDDQPYFRRPMSIYKADAAKGRVEFLYKVTGAGTRALAKLQTGETMRILGPLGIGFRLDPAYRHIVVIGRGVGLATLAPLAEAAAANNTGVTALLSARSPDHVMSVGRFAAIGAETVVLLDTDGSSDPDNVEAHLRRLHRNGRLDAVFVCGSNRLMLLAQRLCAELGIPGQVALEQQMACGIGMCFACVRDFQTADGVVSRRVCCEGPVFEIAEALTW